MYGRTKEETQSDRKGSRGGNALVFSKCSSPILASTSHTLTEDLRVFPESLEANNWVVP
jgi:hypothetical protein